MSIIRFTFDGNSKPLQNAADDARTSLAGVRSEMREGASTAAKWGAATAAAAAVGGAAILKSSFDSIDAQTKLARTLHSTAKGLEVIERAGGFAGVSITEVAQASKDLERRLSQAAAGTGAAVDALDRLQLTAEQLQALPLDERIETINSAILQFIPAAERAAVAGQLFGEEGSLAMQRLDPAGIAAAREEVERFGTVLSDVDASKIEAANDAIARAQMVADGFTTQLSGQLAPIVTALADQFSEAGLAGESMSEKAANATSWIVDGVGFAMDAVDGLRRVGEVAGNALATAFAIIHREALEAAEGMIAGPVAALNELIEAANAIPGISIDAVENPELLESIRADLNLATQVVEEGKAAIDAILAAPMPSEAFEKFVLDAQAAAQEAAEAAAGAAANDSSYAGGGAGTGAEGEDVEKRLEALRQRYASERELAAEQFMLEQETLAEALELEKLTRDEYNQLMAESEAAFQAGLTATDEEQAARRRKIIEDEGKAKLAAVQGALGGMSTLMNSESRKMFEIGKAAALSNAAINAYEAVTSSYRVGSSIGGPIVGAAFAAAAGLAQFQTISAIQGQSFGGGGGSAAATGSNTAAINAATTPVGGGGGSGGQSMPRMIVETTNPDGFMSTRTVASMLQTAIDEGFQLQMAGS